MNAAELRRAGKSFNVDRMNSGGPAPSISLPSLLFQAADDSASIGLAFAAYSSAILFPVREMDSRFAIASPVLGMTIHDMDTSSLGKNITITLPIQRVSLPHSEIHC